MNVHIDTGHKALMPGVRTVGSFSPFAVLCVLSGVSRIGSLVVDEPSFKQAEAGANGTRLRARCGSTTTRGITCSGLMQDRQIRAGGEGAHKAFYSLVHQDGSPP